MFYFAADSLVYDTAFDIIHAWMQQNEHLEKDSFIIAKRIILFHYNSLRKVLSFSYVAFCLLRCETV